jgi:hypothetical protein
MERNTVVGKIEQVVEHVSIWRGGELVMKEIEDKKTSKEST